MNYTELEQYHKRQILVNSRALWLPAKYLEMVTIHKLEKWLEDITNRAQQSVDSMSDEEVNTIREIEKQPENSSITTTCRIIDAVDLFPNDLYGCQRSATKRTKKQSKRN